MCAVKNSWLFFARTFFLPLSLPPTHSDRVEHAFCACCYFFLFVSSFPSVVRGFSLSCFPSRYSSLVCFVSSLPLGPSLSLALSGLSRFPTFCLPPFFSHVLFCPPP